MDLRALRFVAALDAANVVALWLLSPPHGAAALAGYAPALVGTALVHADARRRPLARALCVAALVPNTAGAVAASMRHRRSRAWGLYVGIGGAVIGVGYLAALRR
ncbi:MAG: hypothetical protein HY996_02520 [Micrococcales bacterium]|nr:hypothetical protein [Micrococcales bacterium]